MELVLSPGYIGDNDTSPFHNEDVHEWSHVDRLTGMLENARIESGRWQAKNHETAQSYGKVVDSRERNSADGNVVQRAQRKVEVFQSQEIGGKSIQVVRASQWSSSRVSDLIHSSSLSKSAIEHHASELDNGIKSRLNDWSLSKDLDPLASLCRKIHSEVVNDSHPLLYGQSNALLTDQLNLNETLNIIDKNKYTISSFNEKRSNSNEDLASLIEEEYSPPSFNLSRDYRIRRSLQLSNKKNVKDSNYSDVKLADLNNSERDLLFNSKLSNSQARLKKKDHLDEDNHIKDSYSSPESLSRNAYIGGNSFLKSRSPATLISNKANIISSHKPMNHFFKDLPEKNRESMIEIQKPTSIRFCAQDNRPVISNKTIVHLGKAEDEPTRHMKVIIDSKNTSENQATRDLNTQESNILFLPDCSTKPTKKVGFCKTEVHFVADCGKVNIVETDGKPPPTNRFRRRRRNSNSNTNNLGISGNKNLPVIHFGDTSYEKYIFGASKKRVFEEPTNVTKLREEEDYTDVWQSSIKPSLTLKNESELKKISSTENDLINTHEKIVDQKNRGHTTTVNFGANGSCNLRSVIRDGLSKLSNVEEVSLEAPKIISALDLMTRKEDHKSRSVDSERIVSGDNQILVNPIAIQRPISARFDFEHSSKPIKCVKRLSNLSTLYPMEKLNESEKTSRPLKPNEVNKLPLRSIKSNEMEKGCSESDVSVTQEAKDNCDVNSGAKEEIHDSNSFNPIYVNIFESVRKDMPIYENFLGIKNNSETEVGSKKMKEDEKQETKIEPHKREQEEVSEKIQTQIKQKLSSSSQTGLESKIKSVAESNKIPSIRQCKRDTIIGKEKKIEDSDKAKRVSNKRLETDLCDKVKSHKINKECRNPEDCNLKNSKISSVKRELKRTGSKSRNAKPDSECEINVKGESTNSTKVKKPVEVVYRTAIYNMKNEKLSKPSKTKESKGPRYINDIICGSKVKKSSINEHGKKNTTSQKKSS